ncbi:MAG: DUF4738 domain-containing protein [Bacteroides sp.]|nr:DUF4738 domain-containing protein [Bacteroides sp.]
MKRLILCLAGGLLLLLAACGSRQGKEESGIRVLMLDGEKTRPPQQMEPVSASDEIAFKGKTWHSILTRRPNNDLPLVKNEQGELFVDNEVTLQLLSGGKALVEKTFTKNYFAPWVSVDFLKHAILEGFIFDKVTPQAIHYAVTLCYPQSDLYVPLSVAIAADGKITVEKQEMMEEPYEE